MRTIRSLLECVNTVNTTHEKGFYIKVKVFAHFTSPDTLTHHCRIKFEMYHWH